MIVDECLCRSLVSECQPRRVDRHAPTYPSPHVEEAVVSVLARESAREVAANDAGESLQRRWHELALDLFALSLDTEREDRDRGRFRNPEKHPERVVLRLPESVADRVSRGGSFGQKKSPPCGGLALAMFAPFVSPTCP